MTLWYCLPSGAWLESAGSRDVSSRKTLTASAGFSKANGLSREKHHFIIEIKESKVKRKGKGAQNTTPRNKSVSKN